MLLPAAAVSGLADALSRALSPWRLARSVHDPGKTVLDLVVAIALGGDCLADAAVVRTQSELFGTVASDPTISRLIDTLGDDAAAAITAIRAARGADDGVGPSLAGPDQRSGGGRSGCDAGRGTLGEEGATANFKGGFGFHPLLAFVDHGAGAAGEPLVGVLRPGRANANNAADRILSHLRRWRANRLRRPDLLGDRRRRAEEWVRHQASGRRLSPRARSSVAPTTPRSSTKRCRGARAHSEHRATPLRWAGSASTRLWSRSCRVEQSHRIPRHNHADSQDSPCGIHSKSTAAGMCANGAGGQL